MVEIAVGWGTGLVYWYYRTVWTLLGLLLLGGRAAGQAAGSGPCPSGGMRHMSL